MRTVRPPRDHQKFNWAHARANCHRHQRLTSLVITSLRRRLGLTQVQLAKQIGVTTVVISRWERLNGSHPPKRYWNRIRELWWLSKWAKTPAFQQDRVEPADFSQ